MKFNKIYNKIFNNKMIYNKYNNNYKILHNLILIQITIIINNKLIH